MHLIVPSYNSTMEEPTKLGLGVTSSHLLMREVILFETYKVIPYIALLVFGRKPLDTTPHTQIEITCLLLVPLTYGPLINQMRTELA